MIRTDGLSTHHDLDDATLRPFVLGHFHGSGLAFLSLRQHGHRELRLSRHTAAHLSLLLDHFARHEHLPSSFPEPDYII